MVFVGLYTSYDKCLLLAYVQQDNLRPVKGRSRISNIQHQPPPHVMIMCVAAPGPPLKVQAISTPVQAPTSLESCNHASPGHPNHWPILRPLP